METASYDLFEITLYNGCMTEVINIPDYALMLLSTLEGAGFEAWVVGGFVRDRLLGRESHDVDVATDAPWQDVQRVCEAAGFSTHETGVKHGTLTVVLPDTADADSKHAIEVTTYRTDGAYSDARHPENVSFVRNIEEDLGRRDFTINALAYHPERGLLDLFGGLEDMQRGIIRIVGEPKKRFSEDALRILRACRFCSQLGFAIDAPTYQAMMECKHLLSKVSVERVTSELDGFLQGAHVHDALMSTVDVLSFVLPELMAMKDCAQVTPYHIYDVLEHTAWVVQHTPPDRLTRWAALFHDMGKPAAAFFSPDGVEHFYGHAAVSIVIARGIMDRLLMSPKFKEQALTLVKRHDEVVEANPRSVKRMLSRLDGNVDLFRKLCNIKRADALSQAPQCAPRADLADELKRVLDEVLAADEAFTVHSLAINGSDVIAAGVPKGPAVGEALARTLDAVIDGRIRNERDELLEFVALECR